MTTSIGNFKDSTVLTKWTKWFLYAQIIVSVVAIVSGFMEYRLLSDFENGVYVSQDLALADADASDVRQSVVGIVQIVVLLLSGILILKWIHRANYNAHQLGSTDMAFTPGWSIGWYFIPFANLWKPYQAMKEIWKISCNPDSPEAQPISSLLRWWWFFWIVSGALGNASFRLALKAEEISELITVNVVTQLSDAIAIPLCLILLPIITRIYEMQMSHARKEMPL